MGELYMDVGDETNVSMKDVLLQEDLPGFDLDEQYSFEVLAKGPLWTAIKNGGIPGLHIAVKEGDTYETAEPIYTGRVSGMVEELGESGLVLAVAVGHELGRDSAVRPLYISKSSRRNVNPLDEAFKYIGRQVKKIWGG